MPVMSQKVLLRRHLLLLSNMHFEENVEALLGDGLDPILDKEVDMVTYCWNGIISNCRNIRKK